jgi:hypothetical protein
MVQASPLTIEQTTASGGDDGGITFNAPISEKTKSDFARWMKRGYDFNTTADGSIQVFNKGIHVGGMGAGFDPKAMQDLLGEHLGDGSDGVIGVDSEGNFYMDTGAEGAKKDTPAGVTPSTGSTSRGGSTTRGTAGGGNTSPTTAGGGSSGSSGGGSGGGGSGGRPPTGGGTTVNESGGGGISVGVGGGGNGAGPPIDPNAALGVGFGGAEGSFTPGDQRFNDPSVFNTPDSFTAGLDENASLNDILLGAMGEQRATRDAALGIQGGLAGSFEDNAIRQQNEQNALELGANPFSLNDDTISRIQGRQTDLIGQNTERLQQASAARAASSGISRSGIQAAEQDRFDIAGAGQIAESQRGLLVEQATRRPQELGAAINVGNDTLQQQQGARERIAGGAVNILANSNPTADAALLGTLANGGTPQINIGDRGNIFNPAGVRPANNNPIQF